MEILKIIGTVLNTVIISEIILIAMYNFIFVPKSDALRWLVRIMFSAIVLGLLSFYLLASNGVTLSGGENPSIGWKIAKPFSLILDVYIVYILSRDIYKEVKEVLRIRSNRT